MAKILFVTSRAPFPPSSGRKNSLYNYIRILKEELGHDVVVASFMEKGDTLSEKPNFIRSVYELPSPSLREKIVNLVRGSLSRTKIPLQCILFWSKAAKRKLDAIIEDESPDICIADMARVVEYCRDLNIYKISDLDDLLSIRYKRQAGITSDEFNPYGNFVFALPKFLQKILLSKPIRQKVLDKEASLMEQYELSSSADFNQVYLVSRAESSLLNSKLGTIKAIDIPIGVDIGYFGKEVNVEPINDYELVFVGALSVAHNSHACIHFIKDIFPLVLKEIPQVRFTVIGGGAPDSLLHLASDRIVFTGFVPDIRPVVKKATVYVCPLEFGSGIKTKNLEALAMGKPLVTTSIGAENIDGINGRDYLVADSDRDFARAIINLLNDESLRVKIGSQGKQFVEDNWSWDRTKKKLEQSIKKALDTEDQTIDNYKDTI